MTVENSPDYARRVLAGATMVVSFGASICVGTVIGEELKPSAQPVATAPAPAPIRETAPAARLPEPTCPAPSPTDISMATRLLKQPEAPGLQRIYSSKSRQTFLEAEAKKAGVTVYDAEPSIYKILDTQDRNVHKPYTFYLQIAQTFMHKLGVDVELGKPNDPNYLPGSRPPTKAELASPAFANNIVDILTAYDYMPKEYVELAGQKHLDIVAGTKDAAAYAITGGAHDTDYIDIQVGSENGTVPMHEFDHLADTAECGGEADNDPAFEALNGNVKLYDDGKDQTPRTISYTGAYEDHKYARLTKEQRDLRQGKKAAYCKLVRADDTEAKQVVSYSDYHPYVFEDKAETMEALADQRGFGDITPRFPVLYKKVTFLLARLYQHAPNVAKYFADVSYRLQPNDTTPRC